MSTATTERNLSIRTHAEQADGQFSGNDRAAIQQVDSNDGGV